MLDHLICLRERSNSIQKHRFPLGGSPMCVVWAFLASLQTFTRELRSKRRELFQNSAVSEHSLLFQNGALFQNTCHCFETRVFQNTTVL